MARRRGGGGTAARRRKLPRFYIIFGDRVTVTSAPQMRLIIGRHPQCHLRIPLRDVNKKHAVVERIDVKEQWRLINFGTTMPTLINGNMMDNGERHTLEFGDVFEIADYCFYFDRVRKNAPQEHRDLFDQLIEDEKTKKKSEFAGGAQGGYEVIDDDDDDEPLDSGDYDGTGTIDINEDTPGGDDGEDDADESQGIKIKARRGRGRRGGTKGAARRRRQARRNL